MTRIRNSSHVRSSISSTIISATTFALLVLSDGKPLGLVPMYVGLSICVPPLYDDEKVVNRITVVSPWMACRAIDLDANMVTTNSGQIKVVVRKDSSAGVNVKGCWLSGHETGD